MCTNKAYFDAEQAHKYQSVLKYIEENYMSVIC